MASRELALKLVYYGPGLSGKTTNLRELHQRSDSSSRGNLVTLDTADDRTLFFDMLPMRIDSGRCSIRLKVYTVPGQPIHETTRRMVLAAADGVAFIADSRRSRTVANAKSFSELEANLKCNNIKLEQMPVVIQFNKRDLDSLRPDAELHDLARAGREPVYPAVAMRGEGVVETFLALLRHTWRSLEERYQLQARLNVGEEQLLQEAARQIKVREPLAVVLGRCYGGGQGE